MFNWVIPETSRLSLCRENGNAALLPTPGALASLVSTEVYFKSGYIFSVVNVDIIWNDKVF